MWSYHCKDHIDDVLRATTDMGDRRFRNVHFVADHIIENIDKYPSFKNMHISKRSLKLQKNISPETKIRYNVSQVMALLGWERYVAKGSRRAIYIDPRVKS